MIKLGSIIFYKNIPEFLSWLQRIVTNTIYSHTSIGMGHITQIGQQTEFEADIKVRIHSYGSRGENMDVLEFMDVPNTFMEQAIQSVIREYDGKSYGFIQWLTIALRFLFKRLGFKNTHKWEILWGWGTTCSELVYWYMMIIVNKMTKEDNGLSLDNLILYHKWRELYSDLTEYNPDTFVPQDIADIVKRHPKCLRWV